MPNSSLVPDIIVSMIRRPPSNVVSILGEGEWNTIKMFAPGPRNGRGNALTTTATAVYSVDNNNLRVHGFARLSRPAGGVLHVLGDSSGQQAATVPGRDEQLDTGLVQPRGAHQPDRVHAVRSGHRRTPAAQHGCVHGRAVRAVRLVRRVVNTTLCTHDYNAFPCGCRPSTFRRSRALLGRLFSFTRRRRLSVDQREDEMRRNEAVFLVCMKFKFKKDKKNPFWTGHRPCR